MKKFVGFERGMGMGGWLTNYKRFQLLTEDKREILTIGDLEHFQTYITERDVQYIASVGFDHIRLGFDQIVMQNTDGSFREEHFKLLENFVGWCEKYHINAVLNLHKAIGNYCDVESTVHLIDSERLQNNFVSLWLEMERRFSKATNVAFELLNEVNSVDPDKWNALATRTIAGIRAMNKDRIIIYSGAGGWSVEGITNFFGTTYGNIRCSASRDNARRDRCYQRGQDSFRYFLYIFVSHFQTSPCNLQLLCIHFRFPQE